MYCHSLMVNRNENDVPEEILFTLRINVTKKFYSLCRFFYSCYDGSSFVINSRVYIVIL